MDDVKEIYGLTRIWTRAIHIFPSTTSFLPHFLFLSYVITTFLHSFVLFSSSLLILPFDLLFLAGCTKGVLGGHKFFPSNGSRPDGRREVIV